MDLENLLIGCTLHRATDGRPALVWDRCLTKTERQFVSRNRTLILALMGDTASDGSLFALGEEG